MFIICAVFVLISSFKNYASNKDVKKKRTRFKKKQIKGFLKDGIQEIIGGFVEGPVLKEI
uniref:hypothetical protein n=1 Tax=Borreliella tanukii TaxID=56146 RepID=UPI003B222E88